MAKPTPMGDLVLEPSVTQVQRSASGHDCHRHRHHPDKLLTAATGDAIRTEGYDAAGTRVAASQQLADQPSAGQRLRGNYCA